MKMKYRCLPLYRIESLTWKKATKIYSLVPKKVAREILKKRPLSIAKIWSTSSLLNLNNWSYNKGKKHNNFMKVWKMDHFKIMKSSLLKEITIKYHKNLPVILIWIRKFNWRKRKTQLSPLDLIKSIRVPAMNPLIKKDLWKSENL